MNNTQIDIAASLTVERHRGFYPGTRAPEVAGLYGLADKRFAKYANGKWFKPNHEPDRAMNETLSASTPSPEFRIKDVHHWCDVGDIVEKLSLLNSYYPSESVKDGELLANGWYFNPHADTHEFVRSLGGSGTPFVLYDFTIRQGPDGETWIPIHGIISKKAVSTSADAANFLMNFWHSLPIRSRLNWQRYEELISFC